MASPYLPGSSGGGGSPYLSGRSASVSGASAKPKRKRGSFFPIPGFVGNLWGDVENTVVGLGPAAVTTGRALYRDVRDPFNFDLGESETWKKVLRPVAKSYAHTYGPLVRGEFGEFGHRLYEHPLGPILDAATVLSLGAGGAAKAGLAPAAVKRGYIEVRTPSGEIVRKPLAKQTLRAELQVGRAAAYNRLAAETPFVGESVRAGRQVRKGPLREARARELLAQPFLRTLAKVRNHDDQQAAFWITQTPLPQDLGALSKILDAEGSATALKTTAMLRNERFLESYMRPNPKLLRIVEEAGYVADAQRAILGITDDVARQRAYMPTLIARGAKYVEQPVPTLRLSELEREIDKVLRPLVDEAFPAAARQREQGMRNLLGSTRGKRAAAGLEREIEAMGVGGSSSSVLANAFERIEEQVRRMGQAADADPRAKQVAEMLAERDQLKAYLNDPERVFGDLLTEEGRLAPAPGYGTIDDMIAKIDADLEAAGRPKPVYMPHTSEAPSPVGIYGSGGAGPQRTPGPLRQTMGILLGRGQLIQEPQVLARSFAGAIKFRLYSDIHALHIKHAVPVDELPRGWQFVRRKHSERIPYTAKTAEDFKEFAARHLDDEAEFRFDKEQVVFTTTARAEAVANAEGRYLAVPTAFSRELTGEFVRSGRFAYLLNKYPVRVWRHLVLKVRSAWLVNNILGNTLLYFAHSSDPVAFQELARTFRGLTPKKDRAAFDALMRKNFPEQIHGTFMGSQLPVFPTTSKLATMERTASVVGVGMAHVDRLWEQSLRSAIVRAELRKSPELRQFAGKMRRQTDEFWKLADEELARNPLLGERISDRVNDALGDFLALGRFERNTVRSAFPFYAWYRVITLITLKMPLTHPVKTALLSRLGQAGTVSALEELGIDDPDAINYAKGFFSFGPPDAEGRIRGLATTSTNPYATVGQLQEFVAALAVGKPGDAWEVLPGLNPIFGMPLEALAGVGRARYQNNRYGVLGTSATNFWQSIPQVRLAEALRGNLYQGTPGKPTLTDRDRWDELMRYLGVPYARVSPERVRDLTERRR